jgi:hypothetical protein
MLTCIQCVQRASAAVAATVQYNSSSRVHLQSNDKRLFRDLGMMILAASILVQSEGDRTNSSEPLYMAYGQMQHNACCSIAVSCHIVWLQCTGAFAA